jgi:hypothetical protein
MRKTVIQKTMVIEGAGPNNIPNSQSTFHYGPTLIVQANTDRIGYGEGSTVPDLEVAPWIYGHTLGYCAMTHFDGYILSLYDYIMSTCGHLHQAPVSWMMPYSGRRTHVDVRLRPG